MIVLRGADLVLPDTVVHQGSIVIDGDRIAAVEPRLIDAPAGATRVDLNGSMVVPGFVDVHVHGVEGHDALDGRGAIEQMAARLPRYGVTAFCPTSIACDPRALAEMLDEVAALGVSEAVSARVLPAHLESNFINPEYNGAQPLVCLRSITPPVGAADFSADEILSVVSTHRSEVGIITLAPELEGGLDLVRDFVSAGHRVSIGHTGATYEQTLSAIEAGVSHATHLFNRMPPMTHRAPGAAGAVLRSDGVTAELICDCFHVHPALLDLTIRAKGPGGVMAITDGTAGSGLPIGSRTRLGKQPIVVTSAAARLEDGTLAGSILTMDGAFRALVRQAKTTVVEAARLCATTPSERMGLVNCGHIAVGFVADLVVLDADFQVQSTYVRGRRWGNTAQPRNV